MADIVIIGAGLSGMACAYFLKKPCTVIERARRPGGLCGSVRINGFTFDYSGHFLHMRSDLTRETVRRLLGDNLHEVERAAVIHSFGRKIPYPFQANLYSLPPEIREECLNAFLSRAGGKIPRPSASFLSWSRAVFGDGITRHFMQPYNEKLWTVPATRLTADWVAPFVPQPGVEQIRAGAEGRPRTRFGYNARFYYPENGGSGALTDALANEMEDLRCGTASIRVDYRKKIVETSSGKQLPYQTLISTQPLPELLRQMGRLPQDVAAAANRLDWNSVDCFNLAVKSGRKGKPAGGMHWIYFPENKYVFYRAGIYTNVQPSLAPSGYYSLYVEVSRRPKTPPDHSRTLGAIIDGLKDAGVVGRADAVELVNVLPIPCAYVIYDRYRTKAVARIHEFLVQHGIHSVGRYGAWEYSFMEKSILDAHQLAKELDRV